MEHIFEAVLANDPSRITPGAAHSAWKRISSSRSCRTCSTGATRPCTWPRPVRYDAARALLAAGTPVNGVNRRGATALHYACDARPLSPTWDPAAQRRVIELLVSAGAAVDQPDRGGVTALHRAVRARSPAAVAALLSAGADPRAATTKAGSTPLHLAVAPTGASGTAGAGELQLEIVRMLLAAGATLADVDRNGVAVADRIQSQALRNELAAGCSGHMPATAAAVGRHWSVALPRSGRGVARHPAAGWMSGTDDRMSLQPADRRDPPEPYEVIHLGGEAAAIVPLAELRRLRAAERHASPEARKRRKSRLRWRRTTNGSPRDARARDHTRTSWPNCSARASEDPVVPGGRSAEPAVTCRRWSKTARSA